MVFLLPEARKSREDHAYVKVLLWLVSGGLLGDVFFGCGLLAHAARTTSDTKFL